MVFGLLLGQIMVLGSVHAVGLDLSAQQVIVVDVSTNTVLFEKNADVLMTPSSLSKIMTIYDVFDRLKSGTLAMSDTFRVSEKAWRTQGSKMFVHVGDDVTVGDLLRGAIVQSGNDACVVLAEGLAATEESYADHLTTKARELGAKDATFTNASGMPQEGHKMTARDLMVIAHRTVVDFPEYYPMYKEVEFTYNNIKQGNRNPLLYDNIAADGIKTGHSDEGGFGLVGSAVQDGRRILFVINGCPSIKARAQDARLIVNYAFRSFKNVDLNPATTSSTGVATPLAKLEVIDGVRRFLDLKVDKPLMVTVPTADQKSVTLVVDIPQPLVAPVALGQPLGVLKAVVGDRVIKTWTVNSPEHIEKLGFFSRLWQRLMRALLG